MSSWIPLDVAAKTLLEVCQSSAKDFPSVVHIVHPRPIQWSIIMKAFSESSKVLTGKELSLLPFNEWNRLVVQAASSVDPASAYRQFPSTTIQTIFDAIARADALACDRYGPDSKEIQALGAPCLQTSVCVSRSSTLESAPVLCTEYVACWIKYWQRIGLFIN